MGSRSGDLDPSVVTYLIKKAVKPTQGVQNLEKTELNELTPGEIEEILNKKSGVYGISRISLDFRDIELDSISRRPSCSFSFRYFRLQSSSGNCKNGSCNWRSRCNYI